MNSTIDKLEIKKFSDISHDWWNPKGKFKLLHKINPVRLSYFRKKIIEHFNLDSESLVPFKNLRFLDVGCGGGLISNSLSKMGAEVIAIDASEENIEVARKNSTEEVQYIVSGIENLPKNIEKFDCIFVIEILEHVADLDFFVDNCTKYLKPGGMIIASTLNKTLKSYFFAILVAEYVLNFLPKNTHDWKKFIKPSFLVSLFRKNNLQITELKGMSYNIFKDKWFISADIETNYIAVFKHIK